MLVSCGADISVSVRLRLVSVSCAGCFDSFVSTLMIIIILNWGNKHQSSDK